MTPLTLHHPNPKTECNRKYLLLLVAALDQVILEQQILYLLAREQAV
jgi:hypothetical protein